MARLLGAFAAATLAAAAGGCSGGPLAGIWTWPSSMGSYTATYSLELDSGGGATAKVMIPATADAMCSGTITTAGLGWGTENSTTGISQTPQSTLAISGPGNCSGTITCTTATQSTTFGCSDVQSETFDYGDCPYTLSTDGNTLSVQCPDVGGYVYTRSTSM
jgi:hypothetical protein